MQLETFARWGRVGFEPLRLLQEGSSEFPGGCNFPYPTWSSQVLWKAEAGSPGDVQGLLLSSCIDLGVFPQRSGPCSPFLGEGKHNIAAFSPQNQADNKSGRDGLLAGVGGMILSRGKLSCVKPWQLCGSKYHLKSPTCRV